MQYPGATLPLKVSVSMPPRAAEVRKSPPKATPGGLLFPHSNPHPHGSFSADSRRETRQPIKPPGEEDSEAGLDSGLCLLSLSGPGRCFIPAMAAMCLQLAMVSTFCTAIHKTLGAVGMNYSGDFSLSRSLWSWAQGIWESRSGHRIFPAWVPPGNQNLSPWRPNGGG